MSGIAFSHKYYNYICCQQFNSVMGTTHFPKHWDSIHISFK